jgi:hypothetical protein
MRVFASNFGQTTYVSPSDMQFYEERRAVIPWPEATSDLEESINLKELPSALIFEPEFDLIGTQESLATLALEDIQEIASGRLTDWKEDEHLGENFLFQTMGRKRRV